MDTDNKTTLALLHADIDARIQAIRTTHADWPCRRGCDACCRQLADVPRITAAEWAWLREGLAALPPDQMLDVSRNMAALARGEWQPGVCPLLDQSARACRVYSHRPIACRTYGFYVQRGQGLYCSTIEAREADISRSGVVWGNQDTVDHRLRALGEARDLSRWFQ